MILTIERYSVYGYGWPKIRDTDISTPNTRTRTFSYIFPYLCLCMHPIDGVTVLNISVRRICVCIIRQVSVFFFSFSFLSHILFCSWHFNVYYLLRFFFSPILNAFFRIHVYFYFLPFVLFSLFFFRFYNSLGLKLYHQHRHAISIVTTSFRIGCIFWSGLLAFRCNLFRIMY